MELKESPSLKEKAEIRIENIPEKKDDFTRLVEEFLKKRVNPQSFYSSTSALPQQNLNTVAKTLENLVKEGLTDFDKALKKAISSKNSWMIDAFHDLLIEEIQKINQLNKKT